MLGTVQPEINICVADHLRDAISQAIQHQNGYAAEALTEALQLIEQNTEYVEGDFETYADRAIEIVRESER